MDDGAAENLLRRLTEQLPIMLDRLRSRRSDMDRYRYLMDRVWRCDVRTDADFQRTFNGLYMVRRGPPWRKAFYDLLESEKVTRGSSFDYVLSALHDATGRVEASFASKLFATVDPDLPVYDSWVRLNLSLAPRSGPADQRIPALCDDYAHIARAYCWIIGQPAFASIRTAFNAALPDLQNLSDVKKIDLLFWQDR